MAGQALVLGRVSGFRGARGELTVKVISGDAHRWVHLTRVLLDGDDRTVASARAYRDRLVLKLAGIEDATGAAALRGMEVSAHAEDVPRLPEDVYWVERLVGARVMDVAMGDIGCVKDVVKTGGVDLLLVDDGRGGETLVPLAKDIVTMVDEAAGMIRVTLPEGLRGLNA
jgi:16S rRNA processing protein RimM